MGSLCVREHMSKCVSIQAKTCYLRLSWPPCLPVRPAVTVMRLVCPVHWPRRTITCQHTRIHTFFFTRQIQQNIVFLHELVKFSSVSTWSPVPRPNVVCYNVIMLCSLWLCSLTCMSRCHTVFTHSILVLPITLFQLPDQNLKAKANAGI